MRKKVDFLVIGSGIAGLSYALKVADYGSVLVISKTKLGETNTSYAQGGIASVTYEPDNFEKHIEDTMIAGDYLSNPEAVRMVVENGPGQIKQLIEWGTEFDKKEDKLYDLHKEGGHSEFRILHHLDNTGFEIQRALIEKAKKHPNIELTENYYAVDIITQHHLGEITYRWRTDVECYGAYVLNEETQKVDTVLAKITMMASGGIGNIYQTTTNPTISTGDGIAMVYRAKGIIENMEFVQFHPTSLYNPKERPSFLITEAMRGYGALLRRRDGALFMEKYDKRGCLAPRDIVARAIDNEMKNTGDEFVYLDVTHKDAEETKKHFPTIYNKCLELNVDITKDMIPVVPAAHYLCGGIKVDLNGRSSIQNLYAAGECSSTGLHGANRLASNSLLEAIVYADKAAKDSLTKIDSIKHNTSIPSWNDDGTSHNEEMVLITQTNKEVEQILSNYVGIVRSNLRLKRALDRLELIYKETESLFDDSIVTQELCELRNKINVGYLIIRMAMKRKESKGLHYTIDHNTVRTKV
ncbi:L-aspartate oxidase [Plebeiibacterium sediminum]|uniref:L-aspartate oxidase n=1 Tax=Plebeiibacterium sediminum TaxID=2992112 RepID=A0AAE3M7K2_9BACT|nr:L-aspartate oxidase [Plebeiobacterium sediminum]MCW3788629.1 L-aspartate oxidase [Plebeiobacterium sediminum]